MFGYIATLALGAVVTLTIARLLRSRKAPEEKIFFVTAEKGESPIIKLADTEKAFAWAGRALVRNYREVEGGRLRYQPPEGYVVAYHLTIDRVLTKLIREGEVVVWEAHRELALEQNGLFSNHGFGAACKDLFGPLGDEPEALQRVA